MQIGLSNPFNYTGSKHRYLRELREILPTDDNLTACDPFVGGGDLCTHLNKTWSIYASDTMPQVIEMHNEIMSGNINVESLCVKAYSSRLNNKDVDAYDKFKRLYNKSPSPFDLYLLLCHSFSNDIRFSSNGYNVPFGKRWFNLEMQKKLYNYIERLHDRSVSFCCHEYAERDFSQFDITLIDPPYLNSVATYNERGGWLEGDEIELHDKIKLECDKFVYFGQIWSNGKHNKFLDDFSKNYNFKILKDTTKHCSANRKDDKTVELMIWNF
jgi:DNA adenine methylase Dam